MTVLRRRPVSRMRKPELLAYAADLGLAADDTMTVPALRGLITAHLRGPAGGATGPAGPLWRPKVASPHDEVHRTGAQAGPPGDQEQSREAPWWFRVASFGTVSGVVLAAAGGVSFSFYDQLGAAGAVTLTDSSLLWRAVPILLALAVPAAVLLLVGSAVLRLTPTRSARSRIRWVPVLLVVGFVLGFSGTVARGAIDTAVRRIQTGQEVSAVVSPIGDFTIFRSEAYYVQDIEVEDEAAQERFRKAKDRGDALTWMYLKADDDLEDKEVLLYDYERKRTELFQVIRLCAGSRSTPGLAINCDQS